MNMIDSVLKGNTQVSNLKLKQSGMVNIPNLNPSLNHLEINVHGDGVEYVHLNIEGFNTNLDITLSVSPKVNTFVINSDQSISTLNVKDCDIKNIQIIPSIRNLLRFTNTKDIELLYLDNVVKILHIGNTKINCLLYKNIQNIFGAMFDVQHLACLTPFTKDDETTFNEIMVNLKRTKIYNTHLSDDQEGAIYGNHLIGYGKVIPLTEQMKHMKHNFNKFNLNDLNNLVLKLI